MFKIDQADTQDLPKIRELFIEYARSLNFDLSFQGFEEELGSLPDPYFCILLAYQDSQLAGCVAIKKWIDETAEMKRLYVRPQFQGLGIGRKLSDALIQVARQAGYKRIRLDTVPDMTAAIKMYKSMGFVEISPYRENPIPGTLYLEKDLTAS